MFNGIAGAVAVVILAIGVVVFVRSKKKKAYKNSIDSENDSDNE